MELLSTRQICKLIYDTLSLLDKRPIQHGERTSYILYKLLQDSRRYERYEIADFVFLAGLHDIGAYKTEDLNETLRYETKDYLKHSVYGYLLLKNLSPYEELSKIILYHHTDYNQSIGIPFAYNDISNYLHLAEMIDIYKKALGPKFSLSMFQKYADVKFSKKQLDHLNMTESRYEILKHLEDESYKEDLENIRKYLIWNKNDNQKLLEMLMHLMGLRSEYATQDSFACTKICQELAKKLTLNEEDANILYYAAVVHDIGMMTIPVEILEAPRKLTEEEQKLVRTHVECAGIILNGKVKDKIIDVALAHHERFDGSGYPKQMTVSSMSMPMAVLQVADTVAAMNGQRNYRMNRTKNDICMLLQEEARRGRLHGLVVDIMITHYDEIMGEVKQEVELVKGMQEKLQQQFHQTVG